VKKTEFYKRAPSRVVCWRN